MEIILRQRELKHALEYDKETGLFTWKRSTGNRVKPGELAGGIDKLGYMRIQLKGKTWKSHRLAFLYVLGYLPENFIDHINKLGYFDTLKNAAQARYDAEKELGYPDCDINSSAKQYLDSL